VTSTSTGEQFVRINDIPSTDLQGETVLLSIERESYFGLRSTGRRIWQLLEQPHTLDTLCAAMIREFEVDPETCRREVAAFVGRLKEEGLVREASP
jgi:Coenzyme PQQ synthesis protein D (PqqD)